MTPRKQKKEKKPIEDLVVVEEPKNIEPPLIINEDFSYVSPKDGKTYKMSLKEKLFCDSYLDFKGDGVDAVFEAGYQAKNALVAAAIAFENLRKPNLIAYINSKLEEYGFNDDEAFKQHLFLMNQHADLKSKAKAIDMYYKLKGTYAPEKKAIILESDTLSDEDRELLKIINDHARNTPGETKEIAGASTDPVDSEAQN